jgi:hypothetical protein
MGFGPSAQETFVLRTILVRNRVIEENGPTTTTVVQGQPYGHGIELVRHCALWPISVLVQSTVNSTEVICYSLDSKSWDFIADLLPNQGYPEVTKLMTCRSAKVSDTEIRTEILLSTGESDTISLKLKVAAL